MGFFLDPRRRVLGRYGGRDADSAEGRASAAGLRFAMTKALARHRAGKADPRPARPRTVMDFPAARDLPEKACVRCHQVWSLRRQSLQAEGKWSRDELWVYPPPENVGLTLALDEGDLVAKVRPGSSAAKAGLSAGDRLAGVASYGDLQHRLHLAPAEGRLSLSWSREGRAMAGELALERGWRKSDVSWRWSLRSLSPHPAIAGDDLTAEEKKALGLPATALALRQGPFVSEAARLAGVRAGDVIVGIDGKTPATTARQFLASVRIEREAGERVRYRVLRDGEYLDVTVTLRAR